MVRPVLLKYDDEEVKSKGYNTKTNGKPIVNSKILLLLSSFCLPLNYHKYMKSQ